MPQPYPHADRDDAYGDSDDEVVTYEEWMEEADPSPSPLDQLIAAEEAAITRQSPDGSPDG